MDDDADGQEGEEDPPGKGRVGCIERDARSCGLPEPRIERVGVDRHHLGCRSTSARASRVTRPTWRRRPALALAAWVPGFVSRKPKMRMNVYPARMTPEMKKRKRVAENRKPGTDRGAGDPADARGNREKAVGTRAFLLRDDVRHGCARRRDERRVHEPEDHRQGPDCSKVAHLSHERHDDRREGDRHRHHDLPPEPIREPTARRVGEDRADRVGPQDEPRLRRACPEVGHQEDRQEREDEAEPETGDEVAGGEHEDRAVELLPQLAIRADRPEPAPGSTHRASIANGRGLS